MTTPSAYVPALDLQPQLKALRSEIDAASARVLNCDPSFLCPETEAFEKEAANDLNAEHAVGLNSTTDAPAVDLRALSIQGIMKGTPVLDNIGETTFDTDPDLTETGSHFVNFKVR